MTTASHTTNDFHGETHLPGLEGTNPLGFLAALGVQVIFEKESEQPRLWWSDDIVPHAIVDGNFTVERITDQALKLFPLWAKSPALSPGFGGKAKDDAKFSTPEEIKKYLKTSQSCQYASSFATALLAEDSLANKGNAKPTDFYFTAGGMQFLKIARELLEKCSSENIQSGLQGPWEYESTLPSMMWDVTDDRQYALSAADPSKNKKQINPGPEALAIFGLSTLPVFKGADITLTTGCSGKWKRANYTWPIWKYPASSDAVKALLAHVTHALEKRSQWYKSWGILKILQSRIFRSDQGGYGTFSPPQVIWQS